MASVLLSIVGRNTEESRTDYENCSQWVLKPSVSLFSVSARYCIPQCVRLIAGGGGGVDWAESTTGYTFTPCVGSFTSPGIDTR